MYGQPQQVGGPQSMMAGGPGMMPPPQGMPPSMGPQGPQSMVQGYAPGPHSTEGSPVHQLSGYSQPMPQQQGMAVGMEAPQGPGGPPGPLQGPQTQGIYIPPGVNPGTFSQVTYQTF